MRRTKIVATIGPASEDPVALERLIRAGTDVCRLNLSHGPLTDHLRRLAAIRDIAARVGRHVAVMADLPGPKVRAGQFPEGGVEWRPAAPCGCGPAMVRAPRSVISVDYPDLVVHVDVGERVVLGDGEISMRVVSKRGDELVAEVESGGRTQGRPGIHLACERLALHAPTAEDLELAEAMAAAGADYIALSFVRQAADVDELRAVVGDRSRIVAKIETAAALEQLAEITDAADAVMVARGDLGIDCPMEDVPHLQKRILRHCVEVGTPVVTATQMLESMIAAPAPTRAEVSDVANAVFDGTDALMLSAETAIGHDPPLVVTTMSRIAARAESEASYRQWANHLGRDQQRSVSDVRERITQSITHAAWQAADDVGASAILCCTRSGRTAQSMAAIPPAGPAARSLAGRAHARRAGDVVGRRGGGDGGVEHDRRDGVVRRRACRPGRLHRRR